MRFPDRAPGLARAHEDVGGELDRCLQRVGPRFSEFSLCRDQHGWIFGTAGNFGSRTGACSEEAGVGRIVSGRRLGPVDRQDSSSPPARRQAWNDAIRRTASRQASSVRILTPKTSALPATGTARVGHPGDRRSPRCGARRPDQVRSRRGARSQRRAHRHAGGGSRPASVSRRRPPPGDGFQACNPPAVLRGRSSSTQRPIGCETRSIGRMSYSQSPTGAGARARCRHSMYPGAAASTPRRFVSASRSAARRSPDPARRS